MDYLTGVVFIGINVILGFVYGALKTFVRCQYIKILNNKTVFDYDQILAMNILESFRALNVTQVEQNIAIFVWNDIPIVSQERTRLELSYFI